MKKVTCGFDRILPEVEMDSGSAGLKVDFFVKASLPKLIHCSKTWGLLGMLDWKYYQSLGMALPIFTLVSDLVTGITELPHETSAYNILILNALSAGYK